MGQVTVPPPGGGGGMDTGRGEGTKPVSVSTGNRRGRNRRCDERMRTRSACRCDPRDPPPPSPDLPPPPSTENHKGSRFSLTVRFVRHTNSHRPLLFQVMCLRVGALQYLLAGGGVKQGTSTKGFTYTFALLTLMMSKFGVPSVKGGIGRGLGGAPVRLVGDRVVHQGSNTMSFVTRLLVEVDSGRLQFCGLERNGWHNWRGVAGAGMGVGNVDCSE